MLRAATRGRAGRGDCRHGRGRKSRVAHQRPRWLGGHGRRPGLGGHQPHIGLRLGRRGRSGLGRRDPNLGLIAEAALPCVESGEAHIGFEELVGNRRGQRQHVGVPLLELLQPAAGAELGLQRPDRLARLDDAASIAASSARSAAT
jgi:hypothetical protein